MPLICEEETVIPEDVYENGIYMKGVESTITQCYYDECPVECPNPMEEVCIPYQLNCCISCDWNDSHKCDVIWTYEICEDDFCRQTCGVPNEDNPCLDPDRKIKILVMDEFFWD